MLLVMPKLLNINTKTGNVKLLLVLKYLHERDLFVQGITADQRTVYTSRQDPTPHLMQTSTVLFPFTYNPQESAPLWHRYQGTSSKSVPKTSPGNQQPCGQVFMCSSSCSSISSDQNWKTDLQCYRALYQQLTTTKPTLFTLSIALTLRRATEVFSIRIKVVYVCC